jgi:hypothetical protein
MGGSKIKAGLQLWIEMTMNMRAFPARKTREGWALRTSPHANVGMAAMKRHR